MTDGEQDAPAPAEAGGESVGTVLLAGAMNLAIAVAKAVAGLISGSSAMLSEAAHSVADTTTEVFLFVALRRAAKPADRRHPFGHGQEAYVWAFLAAMFTFLAGGGFSIGHGVQEMSGEAETGDYLISYIVLAVSFVLESVSLARAIRQTRDEARRWHTSMARFLRLTPDTTIKAVVLEDGAALTGITLAALGLGLAEATGDPWFDGLASVLIGVLLIAVAVVLAVANMSLLIGRSVPEKLRAAVQAELEAVEHVASVRDLIALHVGPAEIMVAAKVDFVDTATAAEVERSSDAAERRIRARFASVTRVFLDPTAGRD